MANSIHEHAVDNIRFIRETMERAGSFTSIPGWGGVAIGATAIVTAIIAQGSKNWLAIWLGDAVIAAAIGAITMIAKSRRAGIALTSAAARRFFASYFAPIFCAAVLTASLAMHGFDEALPATWLLLYGASFVSSGAFSIRVVPVMGLCFIALGIAASFVSMSIGNILLGTGFGGLHIVFGYIIARNYGG